MKKKVLSLFLVLAMMFSLGITAGAEEPAQDLSDSIIILHTNDVHGAIDGYAKAAALKKTYEDMGAYVLLMDAGDFIQGDPTVSTSEGATAVELMNMAGYDVAAPGNHEFDYGYANLKDLAGKADFPIVAANVLYGGKTAFTDNVTFTAPDGTKIGVFGLDTPETATKAHPAKIKGITFLADDNLAACAQGQVDELEAEGCDIIVCLGHLGIDDESTGNRSIDLLEEVDGIDLFIDGHSHSALSTILEAVDEDGLVNGTLLTSTGTKMENIGVVVISDGVMQAINIPSSDIVVKPDKAVADRAAAIQKEIEDEYGAAFAKTEVELNGVKAEVRTGETNLGNLITDALVWGAAEAGTKVDAALTNGGGIRASIAKGSITKKDVNT
ncbi:MAG: bifunctional UDP-sugar hydrolase/5'-nucleotidase, partial [Oscillospiraceae bacterium]|nr:bifunctional UDP-sugar hydrolase/5'-nucleotidase [Oscillospiraceae bacterium]